MANIINIPATGKVKFNKKIAELLGFKNFPAGNYVISTSGNPTNGDIPWVANYSSSESNTSNSVSKSPTWSVDGRSFMGAYVRKTNGTGTASNIRVEWNTPVCNGIFLPKLYDYDIGALMNARNTITTRANMTVVQWLKKV